jgi:hypothetical protein
MELVDFEKMLSSIRRQRLEGASHLWGRNPAPNAQQAAQNIAPKSSQELLEVHRRGTQDDMERISGSAFRVPLAEIAALAD